MSAGETRSMARRYAPTRDGSSTVAKIAVDLRPSADGSAVRTSLVAGGSQAAAASMPIAYQLHHGTVRRTDRGIA